MSLHTVLLVAYSYKAQTEFGHDDHRAPQRCVKRGRDADQFAPRTKTERNMTSPFGPTGLSLDTLLGGVLIAAFLVLPAWSAVALWF
jgi:hypothetical protein